MNEVYTDYEGLQYSKEANLWYKYDVRLDMWRISDTEDCRGNMWLFNASNYRIDEAFDKANNHPDYIYYLKYNKNGK